MDIDRQGIIGRFFPFREPLTERQKLEILEQALLDIQTIKRRSEQHLDQDANEQPRENERQDIPHNLGESEVPLLVGNPINDEAPVSLHISFINPLLSLQKYISQFTPTM